MLSSLLGLVALAAVGAPADLPLNFVRAPGAVTIDGKLNDWVLAAPVNYEVDPAAPDRSVRTYAMWDDQYLYLAYAVRDSSPMKNAGSDPGRAFKTGDSLHFYLSTSPTVASASAEGGPTDFHVLMSVLQGQPVVFAYRQQAPGVTSPTVISSPATKIEMAWQGPVPGAVLAVQNAPDGQGYTAEVKLPLAFFGDFRPTPGREVAADVAVNFSDSTGTTNLAKVWWHRGSSQVLDVPTELRMERDRWGTGLFRAAGETPLVIDGQNFFVVPAPGPVTVDGDLSDWDMSCAYGPHYVDPAVKDKYNVTWAAMYDDQALYLGAIFNEAGPYLNEHGVDNTWWLGDSLEFRLSADTKWLGGDPRTSDDILTFGVWHNPTENKDYVALQRSFNFTIGDVSQMEVKSQPTGTGRTFELRVPWSVVKSGNYPRAGQSVSWTMSGLWSNGLRAFGMGSISSYRSLADWGQAHFLATGRPPLVYRALRQPVAVEMPINVGAYQATLPAPAAGLLSAGVYDSAGRLVRALFAGREVPAGPVVVGWDGQDDAGQMVPAGAYELRAISNAGLHAQFVSSATSPGKPAHASANPRGGWGGVWGNVVDMGSDPTGLYALWAIEEGDGGLLHLDEEGNLLWRQHLPLALPGPQSAVASNGKYVFAAVDLTGPLAGRAGLWRVSAQDGGYLPFAHEGSDPLAFCLEGLGRPADQPQAPEAGVPNGARVAPVAEPPVTGLACNAERLYVAAYYQDRVAIYDPESGRALGSLLVRRPTGVCLDRDGKLLVVSERRVLKLDPATGERQVLLGGGLEAPHHVAVDARGNLLVTDRGSSQQVKRFDRAGRLLGSYGQPGGRDNNGQYRPDQLLNPAGITVAASGRVFFSEDSPPKVFQRLSADLRYEKLWAGPWYLSGEVCVDPEKPENLYGWGGDAFIRHHVDYQTGTSVPDALWTKFALADYGRWHPRIVHHAGKTYMFCGGNPASLYRLEGDRMLLVAAVGVDVKDKQRPAYAFTDRNENGAVDPGEMVMYPAEPGQPAYHASYWAGGVDERNLSLYLLSWSPNEVWVLAPTWLRPGVPAYDLNQARIIPLAAAEKPGKRVGFSCVWPTPDGGVFGNADVQGSDPRGIGHSSHLSDVYVYRVDAAGNLLWRAGRKASGLAKQGEFYGRAVGLGGPLGPVAGTGERLFDFVDENGQDKVYTQDGLFVGNLLDDTATASPSEYTLFVEHFGSFVYQNPRDRQWYFTAGASGYAGIWRIEGLEQVQRLSAPLTVR
ncbi:MAG TPA: FlgD immunoglobulin-like domain containing protein [Armatimonadota bacterium]|jgi:hypothetical protein